MVVENPPQVTPGKNFIISGGLQTQSDTSSQNAHQGLSPLGQPTEFLMSYEAVASPVCGVKSTSSTTSEIDLISSTRNILGQNRLQVDPKADAVVPKAPTYYTSGVASGEAVASNTSRRHLVLVNTSSANWTYLSMNGDAVVGSGIALSPNGGSYEMGEAFNNLYRGSIKAISSGASSNLAIQEDD